MRRLVFCVATLAMACSGEPSVVPDAGIDAAGRDSGTAPDVPTVDDAPSAPDVSSDDARTADVRTDAAPDAEPDAATGCAALGAADCLADLSCTLTDRCVDASGTEPAFPHALTGLWDATIQSDGEKGLPAGELAAKLSLFREDDRTLRGVLLLPTHAMTHRLWGGVGPNGDLGIYFGPAECADAQLCGAAFGPTYTAGGRTTDIELDLGTVEIRAPGVDFRTFVSLHATPSDGFKPVRPFTARQDPLLAESWSGDVLAVDVDGAGHIVNCSFAIERGEPYSLTGFSCADVNDAADPALQADPATLKYADGKAWFALGPSDDDLMVVGRVDLEHPWTGIVARRGDVWTAGDPVDPAEVPMEQVRGTFVFFASAQ